MTASDAVVRVRDLRKSYGILAALDGVSFDIQRGETLALLGPNGAGKSTTIEILEGYRDRSGGEATVLGVDPQHGTLAWKAQLGIVLQSTGEPGDVTVREQLAHFAGFYPNPRNVDEVIESVGLTDKAKTRIRALSGGQRRRVDVALGIVGHPQLLFLDEPTTGFDPEARHEFWGLIRRLKSEGTTILLTTHYLDEAAQLSDRAAVIAGGRLIEIGPIDEIGGADARVPVVRWREASALREERTTQPATFVAQLVARLAGEPESLEVIRPSLEAIYLQLLGQSDASAAPPAGRVARDTPAGRVAAGASPLHARDRARRDSTRIERSEQAYRDPDVRGGRVTGERSEPVYRDPHTRRPEIEQSGLDTVAGAPYSTNDSASPGLDTVAGANPRSQARWRQGPQDRSAIPQAPPRSSTNGTETETRA
ncbi:MAG: ABC transporter ATP-binding protein [Microbacteriaceae bacterium]|nr:MAG: ABC transporter ATP-binding protein [Microbacteriaceae bacterium]